MLNPIIVTVTFNAAAGKRDEMIEALKRGIEEVHTEAGCELYAIHSAEDHSIVMLEKWSSVADLDAHAAGDAVKRLDASLVGLMAHAPVVTRATAIPAGQPEKGGL